MESTSSRSSCFWNKAVMASRSMRFSMISNSFFGFASWARFVVSIRITGGRNYLLRLVHTRSYCERLAWSIHWMSTTCQEYVRVIDCKMTVPEAQSGKRGWRGVKAGLQRKRQAHQDCRPGVGGTFDRHVARMILHNLAYDR